MSDKCKKDNVCLNQITDMINKGDGNEKSIKKIVMENMNSILQQKLQEALTAEVQKEFSQQTID